MVNKKYTLTELNSMTIHDLRIILGKLGGTPGQKPRSQIIVEITDIQLGKVVPVRSPRGRKPKYRVSERLLEENTETKETPEKGSEVNDFFNEHHAFGTRLRVVDEDSPLKNMTAQDVLKMNALKKAEAERARDGKFVYHKSYGGVSVPVTAVVADSAYVSSEMVVGHGVLEITVDGDGYLRNYEYGDLSPDFYVNSAVIRSYKLKTGDLIIGYAKKEFDKDIPDLYEPVIINGLDVTSDRLYRGEAFEKMRVKYPTERILDCVGAKQFNLRAIDLFTPIGFGQRVLISEPARCEKGRIIKDLAVEIQTNKPNAKLITLLIDERPEEVGEFAKLMHEGELVVSTIDESPENQVRRVELYFERAKRLVEFGQDVVVLINSFDRLVNAYNRVIQLNENKLSAFLSAQALVIPKKLFSLARRNENGGSLTVIAATSANFDNQNDLIVYNAVRGDCNAEVVLSRELCENRTCPCIDVSKSNNVREELLYSSKSLEKIVKLRHFICRKENGNDYLIEMFKQTENNARLIEKIDEFLSLIDN